MKHRKRYTFKLVLILLVSMSPLFTFGQANENAHNIKTNEGYLKFVASGETTGSSCESGTLNVLNTVGGVVVLSPSLCVSQAHLATGFPNSNEDIIWTKSFISAVIIDNLDQLISDYSYIVQCTLVVTNYGSSPSTITVDLPISYSNDPVELENNVSTAFVGEYDIVELTGFSVLDEASSAISSAFNKNFKLEIRMEEETYWHEGSFPSSCTLSSSVSSNSDEITFSFGQCMNYKPGWVQLEYEFVGDEVTLPSSIPAEVLKDGATRIVPQLNGSNESYSISNPYNEDGQIFWRVRFVRPFYTSSNSTIYPNQRFYSQWFYPNDPIDLEYGITDDFNYSYSINYTEGGKRKESVEFFDGTNRKRQSLYNLEEYPEMVVISGTEYNYAGNPVIQTLPSPMWLSSSSAKLLDYKSGTSPLIDLPTNAVSPEGNLKNSYDIEPTSNLELYPVPGLLDSTVQGSGRYYSMNNDWLNSQSDEMDVYIPRSSGYAYNYSEYDSEGRVVYQTVPGEKGRIKLTEEGFPAKQFNAYEYAKPTPAEVDMYLGNHAMQSSHYEKVIYSDPNGQATIQIKDSKDRTVLSYITNPPTNLDRIDTRPDPIFVLEDLIQDGANNKKQDDTWIYSETISLDNNSDCLLNYSTTTTQFSLCTDPGNTPICYDCLYNIEFRILDKFGNVLIKWDSDPVSIEEYYFSNSNGCETQAEFILSDEGDTFDMTPNFVVIGTSNKISNADVDIAAEIIEFSLQKGVYTIQKKLSVIDEEYVELLAADYVTEASLNGCLPDEFEFIDDATINQNYEECSETYENDPTPCDNLLSDMRNDLKPTEGKYAQIGEEIGQYHFSIFKPLLNQVKYGEENLISTANSTFSGSPDFLTQFQACDQSCTNCQAIDHSISFRYSIDSDPVYCDYNASALNPLLDASDFFADEFLAILPTYLDVSTTGAFGSFDPAYVAVVEEAIDQNFPPTSAGISQGSNYPNFQDYGVSDTDYELVVWSQELTGLEEDQLYEFSLDVKDIAANSAQKNELLKFYLGNTLIGYVLINDANFDQHIVHTYEHLSTSTSEYLTVTWDFGYNEAYVPDFPHNNGFIGIDNLLFRTKDYSCDCEEAFNIPNPSAVQPLYFPYQCAYASFENLGITYNQTNPALLSISQFTSVFDLSWLEALLPVHPEYCNWLLCELIYTEESIAFEENVNSYSWDDATTNLSPFVVDHTDPLEGLYPHDPLFISLSNIVSGPNSYSPAINEALSQIISEMEDRLSEYVESPYAFDINELTSMSTFNSIGFFSNTSSLVPDYTTLGQFTDWVGTNQAFIDNNYTKAWWESYVRYYLNLRENVLMTYATACSNCDIETLILNKEPPTLMELQDEMLAEFNDWVNNEIATFSSSSSGNVTNASLEAQAEQLFEDAHDERLSECENYIFQKALDNFPIVYNPSSEPCIDLNGNEQFDIGEILVLTLAEALKDECACEASIDVGNSVYLHDPMEPIFNPNPALAWASYTNNCDYCASSASLGIAHEFVNTLWSGSTHPLGQTVFDANKITDPKSLFLLDFNPYVLEIGKYSFATSQSAAGMETVLPIGFDPAEISTPFDAVSAALDGQTFSGYATTPSGGTTIQTSTTGGDQIYLWLDNMTGNQIIDWPCTLDVGSIEPDILTIRNMMYQPAYKTAYHFFLCTGVDDNAQPITLRGFFPSEALFELDPEFETFFAGLTPVEERLYCAEFNDILDECLHSPMIETFVTQNTSSSLLAQPLFYPSMVGYISEETASNDYYSESLVEEMIAGCETYEEVIGTSSLLSTTQLPVTEQLINQPLCQGSSESQYDPICEECAMFYKAIMNYEKQISSGSEMELSQVQDELEDPTIYSAIATELGLTIPSGFDPSNDWEFSYPVFTDKDNWNHFFAIKENDIMSSFLTFLDDNLLLYTQEPALNVPYSGPVSQPNGMVSSLTPVTPTYSSGDLIYDLAPDPNNDNVRFWMDNTSSGTIWFHFAFEESINGTFHDIFIDYEHHNGVFTLADIDNVVDIIPIYGSGDVYEFYVALENATTSEVFYVRGTSTFPIAQVCELPTISLFKQPTNDILPWNEGCEEELYYSAYESGQEEYQQMLDGEGESFVDDYVSHCLDNVEESMPFSRENGGYNYTLYLYDRADNLIATVPPSGVRPLVEPMSGSTTGQLQYSPNAKSKIKAFRNGQSGSHFVNPFDPAEDLYATSNLTYGPHEMITHYNYNVLNEVVKQTTPDAGETAFLYDNVGRIVFSQNAQQAVDNTFSYTIYDSQSRITETGEIKPEYSGFYTGPNSKIVFNSQDFSITEPTSAQEELFDQGQGGSDNMSLEQIDVLIDLMSEVVRVDFIKAFVRKHAVITVYDVPPVYGWEDHSVGKVTNLRGRVSAMYKYETLSSDYSAFDNGIVYHYDETGNVKRLFREIRDSDFETYKVMEYEYDVISGNVKKFHYQPNEEDELIHKYEYDSDNRLTEVRTSRDGVIWEEDVTYDYYRHGPLKNAHLGHRSLQNIEYSYNLNGWLKAVNGMNDMYSVYGSSEIPDDVFSFELYYNENDYYPIGSGTASTMTRVDSVISQPPLTPQNNQLYNGNIAGITMRQKFDNNVSLIKVGRQYRYDQLNRLKHMEEFKYADASGVSSDWSVSHDLTSNYSYDGNGNIRTIQRTAFTEGTSTSPALMDDLELGYLPGSNKLRGYCESIDQNAFENDLDPIEGNVNMYVYPLASAISETAEATYSTCECPFSIEPWPSPITCYSLNSSDFYNYFTPAPPTEWYFQEGAACHLDTITVLIEPENPAAPCTGENATGLISFVVATIPTSQVYSYDENGNLIHDAKEGLDITWNPIGKVKRLWGNTNYYGSGTLVSGLFVNVGGAVLYTGTNGLPGQGSGASELGLGSMNYNYYESVIGVSRNLKFDYDPLGERTLKDTDFEENITYYYYNDDGNEVTYVDGISFEPKEKMITEYYVRDAQGNVIAIYNKKTELSDATAYYAGLFDNLKAYNGITTGTDYEEFVEPLMDKSDELKLLTANTAGYSITDVLDSIDHNDVFDDYSSINIDVMRLNDGYHAQAIYDLQSSTVKSYVRSTSEFVDYAHQVALDEADILFAAEQALYDQHSSDLGGDVSAALTSWKNCLSTFACTDMQTCSQCEDARIIDPEDYAGYASCQQNHCQSVVCIDCETLYDDFDELANLLTLETRYNNAVDSIENLMISGSMGLTSSHYEDGNGDLYPWIIDAMSKPGFVNNTTYRNYLDSYYGSDDWTTEVQQVTDAEQLSYHYFMLNVSESWYQQAIGLTEDVNDLDNLAILMENDQETFNYEEVNDLLGGLFGGWVTRWILKDPEKAPGMSGLPHEPNYLGDEDWVDLPEQPYLYLVYSMDPAEYYLYGSDRIGRIKHYKVAENDLHQQVTGNKHYEVKDHLSNVRATISNRKLVKEDASTSELYFDSDLISSSDYYPFGMPMQRRFENYEPNVTAEYQTIDEKSIFKMKRVPSSIEKPNEDGEFELEQGFVLNDYWKGRGAHHSINISKLDLCTASGPEYNDYADGTGLFFTSNQEQIGCIFTEQDDPPNSYQNKSIALLRTIGSGTVYPMTQIDATSELVIRFYVAANDTKFDNVELLLLNDNYEVIKSVFVGNLGGNTMDSIRLTVSNQDVVNASQSQGSWNSGHNYHILIGSTCNLPNDPLPMLTITQFEMFYKKLYETTESFVENNEFTYKPNYRFGFNGHERDDEVKGTGNSYDMQARMYDPRLGRWMSLDPLAREYVSESDYSFALNSPIQAKDPDGNVVIFINGQHAGSGGQAKYWDGYDSKVMTALNDHSPRYVDGALGGWANTGKGAGAGAYLGSMNGGWVGSLTGAAIGVSTSTNVSREVRKSAGRSQGLNDAADIYASLGEGESVKIVTHSMGTGFARGYVEGMQAWAKENGKEFNFEYELDVNAFQGDQLDAVNGITTQNKTGGLDGGNSLIQALQGNSVPTVSKVPGAKDLSEHNSADAQRGHAIGNMDVKGVPELGNNGGRSAKPIEQGNNNENQP